MADLRRALALALLVTACGDDAGDDTTDAQATGTATTGAATAPTSTEPPATTGNDTDPPAGTTGTPEPTTGDVDTGEAMTTGTVDQPDGAFVAIGDGGRRARSIDGETWDVQIGSGLLDTDEEMAAPDALRALTVGDGYVVAVGGGGNFFVGNTRIMRSTDGGVTWQDDVLAGVPEFPQHKLYGVASSGQTVVAAGMRGKRIRSADGGQTWTDMPFEDSNSRLLGVAALASTFVIVGWTEDSYEAPKTSAILTSADDGLTWGPVDESFARIETIAAGNGTFIAVGTSQCLRSSDGLAWADCGVLSNEFQNVAFTDGSFVLVTLEGLATSADGMSWTAPTLPAFGPPKQLAFGNNRWVGVRWTDRGWSEDLEGWTFTTHATEPLRAVVFVPNP